MTELVKPFQEVFQGIGAAKVEPVHIEVDKTVKPGARVAGGPAD